MLKRRQIVTIALLVSLVIGLAWFDRSSSRSFAQPIKQSGKNQKEASHAEKDDASIVDAIINSTGDFIHRNRDEITASSTFIIAVFTAVLGIFTVSLARSNSQSRRCR
jgi:hypothetical protein